ncbi:Arm DNA-binding domain-containing protein [Arenimonas metalli]|uniref:Arm DNA-binding domain-containing protein n=1 Tax=Arenimonas metalli TaxID=948077 RepID=UPI000AB3CAC2|nr:tyrosine-type recombinase/integrase [Arenimonas metalli]
MYLDFQYRGVRCREQTALPDTPGNRRTVEALAKRIDRELLKGTFDYAALFPDSPRAKAGIGEDAANDHVTPTFSEFTELWVAESTPRWRAHYGRAIRDTLDRIILPVLGPKPLASIDRGDLLGFQAELAKRPGRGGQAISAKRINKLMSLVKAILNEGCDRHGLTSPARSLKTLKQKRSDVMPFSMAEVELLIGRVREDYRPYLTVRLLTGLRTGEVDGLQWQDIDFAAGIIRVERTHSRNGDGGTKNEGSRREVPMVPQVRAALEQQRKGAITACPWVFHSPHGNPIDAVNFANRVWYPLLRHLGLRKRPPYQMRHTAATLMLAAGENPEWVASILGHSTTEMLFRVYSRFIPNLTRSDGRAFAGLVNGHFGAAAAEATSTPGTPGADILCALQSLTPGQLSTLLALAKKAS